MSRLGLLVLWLCVYGVVVWFILVLLAICAEAGERVDQTMADHHHDKDDET